MSAVTITQTQTEFMASAGELRGRGRTMGEALDSLVQQGHLEAPVIIHKFSGDEFFTQAQIDRKHELRQRLNTLTEAEHAECYALLDAELDATQARLKASQPR